MLLNIVSSISSYIRGNRRPLEEEAHSKDFCVDVTKDEVEYRSQTNRSNPTSNRSIVCSHTPDSEKKCGPNYVAPVTSNNNSAAAQDLLLRLPKVSCVEHGTTWLMLTVDVVLELAELHSIPDNLVWEIQIQTLDHKSFISLTISKSDPVARVDHLRPGSRYETRGRAGLRVKEVLGTRLVDWRPWGASHAHATSSSTDNTTILKPQLPLPNNPAERSKRKKKTLSTFSTSGSEGRPISAQLPTTPPSKEDRKYASTTGSASGRDSPDLVESKPHYPALCQATPYSSQNEPFMDSSEQDPRMTGTLATTSMKARGNLVRRESIDDEVRSAEIHYTDNNLSVLQDTSSIACQAPQVASNSVSAYQQKAASVISQNDQAVANQVVANRLEKDIQPSKQDKIQLRMVEEAKSTGGQYFCDTCCIQVPNWQAWEKHYLSVKHQRNVMRGQGVEKGAVNAGFGVQATGKIVAGCDSGTAVQYSRTGSKGWSRIPNEISESQCSSCRNETTSDFICHLCGVQCNGPVPWAGHLASQGHLLAVQKNGVITSISAVNQCDVSNAVGWTPQKFSSDTQADSGYQQGGPPQETTICQHYLKGSCLFGARCRNLHDDEARARWQLTAMLKLTQPAPPPRAPPQPSAEEIQKAEAKQQLWDKLQARKALAAQNHAAMTGHCEQEREVGRRASNSSNASHEEWKVAGQTHQSRRRDHIPAAVKHKDNESSGQQGLHLLNPDLVPRSSHEIQSSKPITERTSSSSSCSTSPMIQKASFTPPPPPSNSVAPQFVMTPHIPVAAPDMMLMPMHVQAMMAAMHAAHMNTAFPPGVMQGAQGHATFPAEAVHAAPLNVAASPTMTMSHGYFPPMGYPMVPPQVFYPSHALHPTNVASPAGRYSTRPAKR
ncbi:hypothetical protein CEUSTIGMA_g4971.t1 [Chlamydomonas eustigma]|uniref:C3H1-type domain-containing protein n=1 Tax=Chlamydomonas eustigma TaxID=1157962 RepID=A0A250X377_9CHLO|nr:hypothetical protein CEUSTIGMA_g4971.t1 [Chlamydomonas eustigma]|eukprot:GAX77527.1 hypothetical protein CEUSTIGMA_g4971.t1 [Chlamydomonas eustigma]